MEPAVRQALERAIAGYEGQAAALDRQRVAAEAEAAALRLILSAGGIRLAGPDQVPEANVPLSDPRWISTREAANLSSRTESTIVRWIEEHGIGRKFAGRWQVWQPALLALLRGERSE